jgi:hypothetical protein
VENWELVARECVRDTVATYAHAGDRFRLEELASCFTETGILEIKGHDSATGRTAIVEMLSRRPRSGAPSPQASESFFVRHFVTNLRFDEVSPERIHSSAYFLVVTGDGPDHWGRYRDVLVPVGDRWLFESRLAAVDSATPGGWYARRQLT